MAVVIENGILGLVSRIRNGILESVEMVYRPKVKA